MTDTTKPYVLRLDEEFTWHEGADEPTRLRDYTDEITCVPDEWEISEGITTVDLALKAIEYVSQYSSDVWSARGWYSEETYQHPYENEFLERSFFLHNFTDEDSRAIHKRFNPRGPHHSE